jgi:hypothetical protein
VAFLCSWCANALKWREREAVYYMTKGSLRFLTSINDVCDTLTRAHNESRRLLCNTRRATWCSWGLQETDELLLRDREQNAPAICDTRGCCCFLFRRCICVTKVDSLLSWFYYGKSKIEFDSINKNKCLVGCSLSWKIHMGAQWFDLIILCCTFLNCISN